MKFIVYAIICTAMYFVVGLQSMFYFFSTIQTYIQASVLLFLPNPVYRLNRFQILEVMSFPCQKIFKK